MRAAMKQCGDELPAITEGYFADEPSMRMNIC